MAVIILRGGKRNTKCAKRVFSLFTFVLSMLISGRCRLYVDFNSSVIGITGSSSFAALFPLRLPFNFHALREALVFWKPF